MLGMSVGRLAELMRAKRSCVVLTGAGISTESGIPDFRSPSGVWAQYDPMEYATIDAFLEDPVKVWDFYGKRLAHLDTAVPNDGHRALAELEERGWVRAVVTQNIDRLHRKAGTTDLVEVHGSIETSSCLADGERYPLAVVRRRLDADPAGIPRCDCGRPLKPDVVLFGEWLPEAAIDRAFALAADADVLLCVGSSLEVHPVAQLPGVTHAAGGAVAVVTQGPTPWDDRAAVRLGGDVVEELQGLVAALDG